MIFDCDEDRQGTRGIRVETIADYRHELGLYALPLLGRLRLAEIEPRHIKELAALVSDGGRRKPRTVKLAIAPLRALLATAVEDGLIRSNPASGVRVAQPDALREEPEDAPEERALTRQQLGSLIEEVPAQHRPFVTFVAQTGLRIGEAIAVQWRDLDLDEGRLYVRRRYYRGAYAPPKTRYGRRVIPLTPGMTTLLRERRATFEPVPAALVWPTRSGRPINADNARARVLKPAAVRAAVPWASWHALRQMRRAAFPRRVEHQSRAALPWAPLGRVHAGRLCALPTGRHAQQRVPGWHHRAVNRRLCR